MAYSKNPVGRPLLFKSVEELEEKIQDYFNYCDENKKPYTITGLAVFLDTDRATLVRYQEKDQFCNTIKKAKAKIEANMEERALIGQSNHVFTMFSMKNNYGWSDKGESDTNDDAIDNVQNVLVTIKKVADSSE